jgi:tRNA threonylcarbamoyladenosine biosynthesis protein TsaE
LREPVTQALKRHLPDADATAELGAQLAQALPWPASGWRVLLVGELGSGKSTLARAVIRALGHEGPVPSPTYTLVEPYEVGQNIIYHIDLYRIVSTDELQFLGFHELGDGLMLVEWPDRAEGLEQRSDIRIELSLDGAGRLAVIEALSERAAAALRALPGH